eukprot:g903.t1
MRKSESFSQFHAHLVAAVAKAGGAEQFMAKFPARPSQWLPWGPGLSPPKITDADTRCPRAVHKHCHGEATVDACRKCAQKLGAAVVGEGPLACDVDTLCRLMDVAKAAAAARKKAELSGQSRPFAAAELVPSGGFRDFRAEVAGCLLTEAEHVLDIFRAMAECAAYLPFQGTQCFAHDADHFAHHVRLCCVGAGESVPDRAAARMCSKLVRPVLGDVEHKLRPAYDGCVRDTSKCVGLHRDYYMCRLGSRKHCALALTGHLGVNFLKIFRQLSFLAKMMTMSLRPSQRKVQTTATAQALLQLCSHHGGNDIECGQRVADVLGFDAPDARLGDANTDRR